MLEKIRWSVVLNATISRIMSESETNKSAVDAEVRSMIDDISDRYFEYIINYKSMDVGVDSENVIFVKFSATSITNHEKSEGLDNIGVYSCVNLRNALSKDRGMRDYRVEDISYEIDEISVDG